MQNFEVARAFSRRANSYDAHTPVQSWAAKQLALEAASHPPLFPWPLLEIGCGTGHLTQEILDQFPWYPLNAWDISEGMIAQCRRRFRHPSLQLENRDGTDMCGGVFWGGIYSSYALQWLPKPIEAVTQWLNALIPGGSLHLAFPTWKSFPEWRKVSERVGAPCTVNPLPNLEKLLGDLGGGVTVLYAYEESKTIQFPGAADFFRSLKLIGAASSLRNYTVSVSKLRSIIRSWDRVEGEVPVTYNTAFVGLRWDSGPV